MKQYIRFINENKNNDDFQADYKKLKKLIIDFENRFNVGFDDQFKKIASRTPEDVQSISDKNIELMNQEKEENVRKKEEEDATFKQGEKQRKIETYLSQLITITNDFNMYGDISKSLRKLNKKKVDVESYKNIVSKIYSVKLTGDDKIKIKNYVESKGFKPIPKIIYNLNQLLGVKVEKPKKKIFRYKEDFYTVDGYLNDKNKKVTDLYQNDKDSYELVSWQQVDKSKKKKVTV